MSLIRAIALDHLAESYVRNVTRLCLDQGITRADLYQRTGVDLRNDNPTMGQLLDVALALHVEPWELLR